MSDNNTVRVRVLPNGQAVQVHPDGTTTALEDRTDWARVAAMTDQEIEANAADDPDNPALTEAELARVWTTPNLRAIRAKLRLTQEEFSEQFQLPLGTVRDWEQGVRRPNVAARVLLQVIEHHPDAVIDALAAGSLTRR